MYKQIKGEFQLNKDDDKFGELAIKILKRDTPDVYTVDFRLIQVTNLFMVLTDIISWKGRLLGLYWIPFGAIPSGIATINGLFNIAFV